MTERSTEHIGQRTLSQMEDFIRDLGDVTAVYPHITISYFALKEGENYRLHKARLILGTTRQDLPSPNQFESLSIRAGRFELAELGADIHSLIDCISEGRLPTPHGPVEFPTLDAREWNAHYTPLSEAGLINQSRWRTFNIRANRNSALPILSELDWELKAQLTPFQGVNQLLLEFGLDAPIDHDIRIDFVAGNLVAIDAQSEIRSCDAKPGILIASHLDREKASIGYLIHNSSGVSARGCLSGNELSWEATEVGLKGSAKLQIPKGSVVLAFANYDGVTYHEYWLLDPDSILNPRRAAIATFDSELEVTKDVLLRPEPKKVESKNVEAAIAWLLWMLGFSPAHIVMSDKRLSDAVDIIVATPEQRIAVVECTTGQPTQNNKLSKLVSRREQVMARLSTSGQGHVEVIAVIITTRTRKEVATDVPEAEKHAVLVLTREDLEHLFNRSFVLTNPEALYKECKDAIQAGLQKQAQQNLPTI